MTGKHLQCASVLDDVGMFRWVRLRGCADSEALQPQLKEFKVAVVPGQHFHVGGTPGPYVRLSFASATDAEMDAGIERLAQLLHTCRLPHGCFRSMGPT